MWLNKVLTEMRMETIYIVRYVLIVSVVMLGVRGKNSDMLVRVDSSCSVE